MVRVGESKTAELAHKGADGMDLVRDLTAFLL